MPPGEILDKRTVKGEERARTIGCQGAESICRNANGDASRLESQKITLIPLWKINCVESWGTS